MGSLRGLVIALVVAAAAMVVVVVVVVVGSGGGAIYCSVIAHAHDFLHGRIVVTSQNLLSLRTDTRWWRNLIPSIQYRGGRKINKNKVCISLPMLQQLTKLKKK